MKLGIVKWIYQNENFIRKFHISSPTRNKNIIILWYITVYHYVSLYCMMQKSDQDLGIGFTYFVHFFISCMQIIYQKLDY